MGMARFSRLLPCCLDGGASNARCRGPWMGMTRGASAGAAAGEALAWSGKQAKAPNTRIGRPLRPAIARAQRSWGGLGRYGRKYAGRRTQNRRHAPETRQTALSSKKTWNAPSAWRHGGNLPAPADKDRHNLLRVSALACPGQRVAWRCVAEPALTPKPSLQSAGVRCSS